MPFDPRYSVDVGFCSVLNSFDRKLLNISNFHDDFLKQFDIRTIHERKEIIASHVLCCSLETFSVKEKKYKQTTEAARG